VATLKKRGKDLFLKDSSLAILSNLERITVEDVNSLTFNSLHELSGDLTVRLLGTGGMLADTELGQLIVGGMTNVNSGNNPVILDNANNDFVGSVSLTTGMTAAWSANGARQSITVYDANDIHFNRLVVSGNATIFAGGNVTDGSESGWPGA
jgi:hypothetical protein